jgi:hypothetical protein
MLLGRLHPEGLKAVNAAGEVAIDEATIRPAYERMWAFNVERHGGKAEVSGRPAL